jgi:hypothetical protein
LVERFEGVKVSVAQRASHFRLGLPKQHLQGVAPLRLGKRLVLLDAGLLFLGSDPKWRRCRVPAGDEQRDKSFAVEWFCSISTANSVVSSNIPVFIYPVSPTKFLSICSPKVSADCKSFIGLILTVRKTKAKSVMRL